MAAVALSMGVAGCGDDQPLADGSSSSATSDGADSTTQVSGTAGMTSTTGGITTTGVDTTTDGPQTTSAGFIYGAPDAGPVDFECDVWAQDCPEGQKCAPWDNSGGSSWNATKCVPVAPDPAQPGEPCHAEGSPVSGIDDCDLGSICWNVDPKTLEGTCIAQCIGSEVDPMCTEDGRVCIIANGGALTVCLSTCDPTAQDCPADEACYPWVEDFVCAPDPGRRPGGYGTPCDNLGACDPGLFCANADVVPECQGGNAAGCCTSYCDLTDADPDATCTAFSPTLVCTPFYRPGTAPEGYEHVGICIDET